MGYTHYWTFNPGRTTAAKWNAAIADCRRIVDASPVPLDVTPTTTDLWVEGVGDDAHETFTIPSTYAALKAVCRTKPRYAGHNPAWDFCKTARKPYDVVVVACLSVLATVGVDVSSDGDSADWQDGVALASKVLGRTIPNPIAE